MNKYYFRYSIDYQDHWAEYVKIITASDVEQAEIQIAKILRDRPFKIHQIYKMELIEDNG
jgi:hypothetical protein